MFTLHLHDFDWHKENTATAARPTNREYRNAYCALIYNMIPLIWHVSFQHIFIKLVQESVIKSPIVLGLVNLTTI